MRFRTMCLLSAPLSVIALGPSTAKGQQSAAPAVRQEEQQKPETLNRTAEKRALLKEGTEVHLKLAQRMTSKTSKEGQPVEMVLSDDLTVGQDIVARKGARVLGTVVRGKPMLDAEEIRVRADHIKVGDSFIKLTAEQAGVEKRNKEKMVTYGMLIGMRSWWSSPYKRFVIPKGTPATAYVQENIALPILPATPNETP